MKVIAFFAVFALFWAGCEAEQNNRPDVRTDLASTLRTSNVDSADDWGTMADPPPDAIYGNDTVDVYDLATMEIKFEVVQVLLGENGEPGEGEERVTIQGRLEDKAPNDTGGFNYYCRKSDTDICYSMSGTRIASGMR